MVRSQAARDGPPVPLGSEGDHSRQANNPAAAVAAGAASSRTDATAVSVPQSSHGRVEASTQPLPRSGPTAAVFTEQQMLRPVAAVSERGWRRAVYRASGGLVNLGPSPAELAERQLAARVQAPVAGCRRIAVISRKGGVGKSTTCLMLGHTFAAHRGDRVVAVDGNPDAGSLAYRVRRETAATVTSLLADAQRIARYADVRAYTSQAPTRLEVLASDDDPRITQALSDRDYRAAIGLLDRHYNLILLDTGTGILDSAVQGILGEADQLVVVMPPALDGARVAAATLDWLDAHGHAGLVASAVAVINAVRPRSGLVEIDRVHDHFAQRCAAAVRIPWDPHLQAGAHTSLAALRGDTRRAYLDVAAAVADGFASASRRTTV